MAGRAPQGAVVADAAVGAGRTAVVERQDARLLPVDDPALAAGFSELAGQLAANESTVVGELLAVQGQPVDLGGYYQPDPAKAEAAMRPSATFNALLDTLGSSL